MKMIKVLSDKIRHNIREARELMLEAYRLRDIDKGSADWYKEMAEQHMKFITNGHANVKRLIDQVKTERKDSPMLPGMQKVYEEMHADITAEAAEVQGMIAAYK